jgi:hypothetical protein
MKSPVPSTNTDGAATAVVTLGYRVVPFLAFLACLASLPLPFARAASCSSDTAVIVA